MKCSRANLASVVNISNADFWCQYPRTSSHIRCQVACKQTVRHVNTIDILQTIPDFSLNISQRVSRYCGIVVDPYTITRQVLNSRFSKMANSAEGEPKFLRRLSQFYTFGGVCSGHIFFGGFSAVAKIRRIRIFGGRW